MLQRRMGLSERRQRVLEVIAKACERDPGEVAAGMELVADLGIDSAQGLLMLIEIEELVGLEISDDDAEKMNTVEDILNFVDHTLGD